MAQELGQGRDIRRAILDAARKVFAAYGFYGATTRLIAETANVNVAMIHYHFDSKEQLYRVVLREQAEQYCGAALERLAAAADGPRAASLEAVLAALLLPLLEIARADLERARNVVCLANQLSYAADPWSEAMMNELFDSFGARFVDAFARAIPGLGHSDAVWAYLFALVLCGEALMLAGTSQAEIAAGNGLEASFARTLKVLEAGIRSLSKPS